jgi:hypothetical protein
LSACPSLAALEEDARSGRIGSVPSGDVTAARPEDQAQLLDQLKQRGELYRQLRRLVGPRSGNPDIVVGSHVACDLAFQHLNSIADHAASD